MPKEKEQDQAPVMKEVDLPGGVKVSMTEEQFNSYKAKQDEHTTGFNTMKEELDAIKTAKAEAEQRAELREREKREAELASEGKLAELKESVSKDYVDKINELQGKVQAYETEVNRGKIRDAALKIENVNSAALDDITTLAMATMTEDKSLEDHVKELVTSRDYFQMVQTPAGTPRGVGNTKGTQELDSNERLAKGIEKMLAEKGIKK